MSRHKEVGAVGRDSYQLRLRTGGENGAYLTLALCIFRLSIAFAPMILKQVSSSIRRLLEEDARRLARRMIRGTLTRSFSVTT